MICALMLGLKDHVHVTIAHWCGFFSAVDCGQTSVIQVPTIYSMDIDKLKYLVETNLLSQLEEPFENIMQTLVAFHALSCTERHASVFPKYRLDNVSTHVQKKNTEGFIRSLPEVHLHTASLGKGER